MRILGIYHALASPVVAVAVAADVHVMRKSALPWFQFQFQSGAGKRGPFPLNFRGERLDST